MSDAAVASGSAAAAVVASALNDVTVISVATLPEEISSTSSTTSTKLSSSIMKKTVVPSSVTKPSIAATAAVVVVPVLNLNSIRRPPLGPHADANVDPNMRVSLNYTSRRLAEAASDPMTGLSNYSLSDTETTLLGTARRPLIPGGERTIFRSIESARGRETDLFSVVGEIPDVIQGTERTPDDALNEGITSSVAEHTLWRKKTSRSYKRDALIEQAKDSLAQRMVADDNVSSVPPLSEIMEEAILRLKQKLYGTSVEDLSHLTVDEMKDHEAQLKHAATLAKAALDEMNATGKTLDVAVKGTIEAELLPEGLNAVLAGEDSYFELTNARFNAKLSRTDRWLDEGRPMQFDTTYNIPTRIIPCKARTGRFCRPFFASIDPFGEGRFSTFTGFGPGVAAYFKLIKGLFGFFFFATCVYFGPIGWLVTQGTWEGSGFGFLLSLGALGTYPSSLEHVSGIASSWAPQQMQWFVTAFNIIVSLALYTAVAWFREVEASDTEIIEAQAVTIDRFTVELDWLPQEMDAPAVSEWISRQILTSNEAIDGKPVRVVIALELAPYLRTSRTRQRLAAQVEKLECRLATLFVAANLASVFDEAYILHIERRQKILKSEKAAALKIASAKVRAAQRAAIAAASREDDLAEDDLIACRFDLEAAEKEKLLVASKPVQDDEIKRYVNAGGKSLRGQVNATRISEDDLSRYVGTDKSFISRAKSLFAARRRLLIAADKIGAKLDRLLVNPRVVKAWVTFNSAALAASVRERLSFSVSDTTSWYSNVPRWRRMGTHVVRAGPAPKPSAILWADLTSNHFTTVLLYCWSLFLLLFICLGTIIVAFFGQTINIYLQQTLGINAMLAQAAPALLLWIYENGGGYLVSFSAVHCERFATRETRETAVFGRLTLIYTMKWVALVIVFALAGDTLRSGLLGGDFFAVFAPAVTVFNVVPSNGTWTGDNLAAWRLGPAAAWTPGGAEAAIHATIMQEWYANTAPVLVIGGFLGIIGILWVPANEALRVGCIRCCVSRCGVRYTSQLALNRALAPLPLRMEAILAALLAQCGIALISGGGAPLLYAFAALAAGVAYWSELGAFASLYAKPAYRAENVPRAAINVLNVLLVLQCFASMFYAAGPRVLSSLIYLVWTSSPSYSGFAAITSGDTLYMSLAHFIFAFLALVRIFNTPIRKFLKLIFCWTDFTICFSRVIHRRFTPPEINVKVLTLHEAEDAQALDHLRENFKDAQRHQFLLDSPSYDVRDNADFAASFGARTNPKVYQDQVEPPVIPPGYRMHAVGENDPECEGDLLSFLSAENSYVHVDSMTPSVAARSALYGDDLDDEDAVIVRPRKKPVTGEGRSGFAFMKSSRVQYNDKFETERPHRLPEGSDGGRYRPTRHTNKVNNNNKFNVPGAVISPK